MQFFTLATLKTSVGPKAAIGVENQFYLISDLQPKLHVTVKELLASWPTSFSMLEQLAVSIVGGAFKSSPTVSEEKADLATPVIYPNKLMAVGANYTGHLQEMGLPTEKWHPMPFFLRPPTTTLVGPGETVHIPKSTKQFDWDRRLSRTEVRLGCRTEAIASTKYFCVSSLCDTFMFSRTLKLLL